MSTNGRKVLVSGCIGIIVVGMVFFLFGMFMLRAYGDKDECTEQVTAEVVRLVQRKSTSSTRSKHRYRTRITYAPVFEYEYEGKKYSHTSSVAASPPDYSVGDKVEIMIDPDDPNSVYYEPKGALFLTVAFRVMGGVLMAGGVVSLIVGKVKSKTA